MFKWLLAAALGFGSTAALAQVVPQDLNGDATSDAFLDVVNGLLWSQPEVVAPMGFDAAQSAVSGLMIEGLNGWQLPTAAQFQGLYATQGDLGGAMNGAPFSPYATWYWTVDVDSSNTARNLAFSPGNGASMAFFRSTDVGVWAVRAVPEPSSALLMLLGASVLGMFAVRRMS